MEESIAATVAFDICSAVNAIHQMNIVHRDLKTENVMITSKGGNNYFSKVFDFGISFAAQAAGEQYGQDSISGTPEYMAPEMFFKGAKADFRSDTYAVGTIIYEMLAGMLPFDFMGMGTLAEIAALKQLAPPTITKRNPNAQVSEDIERIVMRSIALDPQKRFSSIAALRSELEKHIRDNLTDSLVESTSITFRPAGVVRKRSETPHFLPILPDKIRKSLGQKRYSLRHILAFGTLAGMLGILGGESLLECRQHEKLPVKNHEQPLAAEKPKAAAKEDKMRPSAPWVVPIVAVVPATVEINFIADPTGASVYLNEKLLGKTPCLTRQKKANQL